MDIDVDAAAHTLGTIISLLKVSVSEHSLAVSVSDGIFLVWSFFFGRMLV